MKRCRHRTSRVVSNSHDVSVNHITSHAHVVCPQVGCDGHVWRHQTELIKQLREQAKDGTLAEVLQLPVMLWHVKTDSSSFLRSRREVGSGDYDNSDDYDNYDDYEDGDYEDGGEEREDDNDDNEDPQVQPTIIPDFTGARGNTVPEHPHRHHHGEETIDWDVSRRAFPSSFLERDPRDTGTYSQQSWRQISLIPSSRVSSCFFSGRGGDRRGGDSAKTEADRAGKRRGK